MFKKTKRIFLKADDLIFNMQNEKNDGGGYIDIQDVYKCAEYVKEELSGSEYGDIPIFNDVNFRSIEKAVENYDDYLIMINSRIHFKVPKEEIPEFLKHNEIINPLVKEFWNDKKREDTDIKEKQLQREMSYIVLG